MINKKIFSVVAVLIILGFLGYIFIQKPTSTPFVKDQNSDSDNTNISLSESDENILALLENKPSANSVVINISDDVKEKIKTQIKEVKLLQNDAEAAPWLQEAVLLSSLGSHEESIVVIDKVQELFPYNYASYINKAEVLKRMGLYRDAGAEYLKAVKIDSKNPIAYTNLADLFIKYSDNKLAAKSIYKNGLIKTEENIDLLTSYADFLDNIENNLEVSIEYWNKALEKTQSDINRQAIKAEIESLQDKLSN